MRHVGTMMTGAVDIVENGPEFKKRKALLQSKYLQYDALFSIKQGEGVILRFQPARVVIWDYGAGELNEPHQRRYFGACQARLTSLVTIHRCGFGGTRGCEK